MAGFDNPALLELLKQARLRPTYSTYQRIGQRLAEFQDVSGIPGNRRLRLAVLPSFTIDPIKPYLQVSCLERNIWADVFIPGFNQFAQEVLSGESDLYRFKPDVCFLHVFVEALVPGRQPFCLAASDCDPALDNLRNLLSVFREHSSGELVVSNFAHSTRFPMAITSDPTVGVYRSLNDRLERLAAEFSGVHVLDYDGLTACHGKDGIADERLRHIARMEVGHRFLPKLASKMLAYAFALRGFSRKCIVVDLDETLWGGIVGEDGAAGIKLGPEYPGSAFIEFQLTLLALQQRGVLLAIASKNDESEVIDVLGNHPAMVLRPHHFAAKRINWAPKSENIESIARELNLGLDSFVFIDDNPAERELMRGMHPDVFTPEWPSDVVYYKTALASLSDFETVGVTAEDVLRNEMYQGRAMRENVRKGSGSLVEYLTGLQTELFVSPAQRSDLKRIHQLVQKTNQFNLTTKRYSTAELEAFLTREDVGVFVLRSRDVFGDLGLVGVAIVMKEPETEGATVWRIDSFLMSCRALGRMMEQGFMGYVLEHLKRLGCNYAIGEYVSTGRNELVRDFYVNSGFETVDDKGNASRWRINLALYVPPDLPCLRIHTQQRLQEVDSSSASR